MVSQIDTTQIEETSSPARANAKTSHSVAKSSPAQKNSPKNARRDAPVGADSAQMPARRTRLDTLCIVGDLLEAFRADSQEVYIATGNVQLTRGSGTNSFAARAGTGVYEKSADRIRLREAPLLWLDSTQLRGDSIIVRLRGKRLEQINAFGNAFAATKNDSARQDRVDQLTGNNIVISSSRDTLRSIVAEGKAFNLYFISAELEDGKKESDGAARNAADTIKIQFQGGEAEKIVWLGKIEGEHIPERIARQKLSELNLKGFQWFLNRPRLSRNDMGAATKALAPAKRETPSAATNASKARASKAVKTPARANAPNSKKNQ